MPKGAITFLLISLNVLASQGQHLDALQLARKHEQEHRYEAARTAYEAYLAIHETDTDARYRLGRLYLRVLRDPESARVHLEHACARDLNGGDCHLLLSEAYAGLFMHAGVVDKVVLAVKAKNAIDAAVKCDPASVEYRKATIEYFLTIPGAGGYERAHAEADNLARFDPYVGLLVHASLYGYEGQGNRALEYFDKAIASKPDASMAYEWLGDYHLRAMRFDEAITHFKKAVELAPTSSNALYKLGRAYRKHSQHDAAAITLERAFTINPDSTDIAYDLARTYDLLDRTSESVPLYQRCLSLNDPHGPKADLARKLLAKFENAGRAGASEAKSVQEAAPSFFGPVALAYLLACVGWIILARWRMVSIPPDPFPTCDRPWLELALAGVATVGIFGLGLAYRFGYLLPRGSDWLHHVSWTLNNVIIFSPIFFLLAIRRQGLATVFLSKTEIARKIVAGVILAAVATATFLGLRGEVTALPGILRDSFHLGNLSHFLPVFLEGVVVAFLFVRVRWVLGFWPAVLIPAVLFAIGHVPRQLASGESVATILAFFIFNTLLPAAIFLVVARSRDVVWIGIVHYVMDIAIDAFE